MIPSGSSPRADTTLEHREVSLMRGIGTRRSLGLGLVASAGLLFALGADTDTEDAASKIFLVYSTDERSELAPCG